MQGTCAKKRIKTNIYVELIQVQFWSSVNNAKDFYWGKSWVFSQSVW
jgi:hypothetical protein